MLSASDLPSLVAFSAQRFHPGIITRHAFIHLILSSALLSSPGPSPSP